MKLNLGCGNDLRDGYQNIDLRTSVNPDIVADIRNLPQDDGSVEEIIAQDVLEHFRDYKQVLTEWLRILKPGGLLLVRVPDWETISDTEWWQERPMWRIERQIFGGYDNDYDVHYRLYTKDVLEKRLKEQGFVKVNIRRSHKPPVHFHILASARKKEDVINGVYEERERFE